MTSSPPLSVVLIDRTQATMPKRNSKLSKSLRELGDIQVNDWQLPQFLNKNISELEISRALQRMNDIQVMNWEFKDVMPVLQRLAQKEVDIVDLLKQAAAYKVNEWDIRKAVLRTRADSVQLNKREIKVISDQLKNYLSFMVEQLVDDPNHASILVDEIAPQVLRFRVILKQRDLSMLIGMNGYTANPIRRILKDFALNAGVYAILQIQTHEEAASSDKA